MTLIAARFVASALITMIAASIYIDTHRSSIQDEYASGLRFKVRALCLLVPTLLLLMGAFH